jgi:transmembrane sensor
MDNHSRSPQEIDDQVYLQAAEWIELLGDRPLDTITRKRLQNWLNADPINRKLLKRMIVSWADPALLETLKRYDKSQRSFLWARVQWRQPAWLAASFLVLFALLISSKAFFRQAPITESPPPQVYRSDYQVMQYQLADGSNITQSAAAEVVVQMNSEARNISLKQGAAFFDVASDKQRPFKVNIQGASVTAVGTQFNIDKSHHRIDVTVYEGAVELKSRPGAKPQLLRTGETIRIVNGVAEPKKQVNILELVDWRSGWLELKGEPLSYLLEQLNRYSRIKVKVAQQELNQIPVSGRFQLSDMDSTIEAVKQFHSLQVEKTSEHYVLSKARQG